MPQDSRRYRPFVTCDDPKGVVECGTFRRSKSGSSKMEHKLEDPKVQKNSHSKSKREESSVETAERLHNPATFQLMEVSRGAKKLNHLIDAWSNGSSYEGESKDLANDLLKGAIDLQESLVMLGKLQEASQYMALLKSSQRVKSERRSLDELWRTNSDRFSDRNCPMEVQKPWHSVDGYSKNGVEELKKAIRGGFAGKNTFSKRVTQDEEKYFQHRQMDFGSEFPSTSSSQSSILHSNTASSADSPCSSSAPQKKAQSSNVIARLMGLEEFPSTPVQASPQMQMRSEKISNQGRAAFDVDRDKIVNQKRPIFDIDKPAIRKPRSLVQKEDAKTRSLKEILETVQLKGLTRTNSVKESDYHSHHSSNSQSSEILLDSPKPIVLIKPRHFPYFGSNESFMPRSQAKESLSTELMVRRLKEHREPPSKLIEASAVALNPKTTQRKSVAEEKSLQRLGQKEDKGIKARANGCRPVVKNAEEKESKSKQKSFDRTKTTGLVTSQQQDNVATEKKAYKSLKVQCSSKKAAVKEITRFKDISISQDQDKVMAAKPRRPENISDVTKSRVNLKQSTVPSNSRKPAIPVVTHKSSEQKRSTIKKGKPVDEPELAKPFTVNSGCDKDGQAIERMCEDELVDKMIDNNFEDELVKMANVDLLKVDENESCKVIPVSSTNETDLQSAEVHLHIIHDGAETGSLKASSGMQALSSPAFVSHAQELFDLFPTATFSEQSYKDSGVDNERLTMDYAKDFLELRSLPDASIVHSLSLSMSCNSKICISLDQLLEEACTGLETLTSYGKSDGGSLFAGSLYSVLERDLWGNALVYGIWDLGWRNGFSVNAAEQVVTDIEKLIFNGLIEELLT